MVSKHEGTQSTPQKCNYPILSPPKGPLVLGNSHMGIRVEVMGEWLGVSGKRGHHISRDSS